MRGRFIDKNGRIKVLRLRILRRFWRTCRVGDFRNCLTIIIQ
jgi:hypothetical protein